MPFDGTLTETNTDKLILQRARDRVAKGWCQLNYNSLGPGPACLTGALIGAVADRDRRALPEVYRLTALMGFRPGESTTWNDVEGRTKEEVLARFDEAIARLG